MAALGVEHALCSEPVVVDDRYTGELWRTVIDPETNTTSSPRA
jgi:hypothetical protein